MPLYQSAYAALYFIIRPGHDILHPVTGTKIDSVKDIVADFGTHGRTFNAENPLTGEVEEHVQIRGFFFDSDAAAERLAWTEEEHESAVIALDNLCREQPS